MEERKQSLRVETEWRKARITALTLEAETPMAVQDGVQRDIVSTAGGRGWGSELQVLTIEDFLCYFKIFM